MSEAKNNILIIGAGAVGLVYGKHLAAAGNKVCFFVKEKHLSSLKQGSVLYNLAKDAALKKPISFSTYNLISDFETLQTRNFQQIYLCFSSVALHAFDFENFKTKLNGTPIIVLLQPGITDFALLQRYFPESQIVRGMISLISYYAPLPTENKATQNGIAYWMPALASTPFSGEKNACKAIVQTFKQSKIAANKVKDVAAYAMFPSAFLVSFLVALEAKNWQFKQLTNDTEILKNLVNANTEIFTVLAKKYATSTPLLFQLANRVTAIRAILSIVPRIMPLNLEAYLKAHFTKVNEQTKMYFNDYINLAKTENTAFVHLKKLGER